MCVYVCDYMSLYVFMCVHTLHAAMYVVMFYMSFMYVCVVLLFPPRSLGPRGGGSVGTTQKGAPAIHVGSVQGALVFVCVSVFVHVYVHNRPAKP
mmetsp:Transcript_36386/g.58841  ORF Transcript_36386/g.58841 Transcript_36386/m.58841 type:complete len:95 (+) Transcript_36386:173-457(+)